MKDDKVKQNASTVGQNRRIYCLQRETTKMFAHNRKHIFLRILTNIRRRDEKRVDKNSASILLIRIVTIFETFNQQYWNAIKQMKIMYSLYV